MNKNIYYSKLLNKYKPSYDAAFHDLGLHTVFMYITLYLLCILNNSILSLPIVILLSLLLNRSFVIFHDCCHNSYTPNTIINYVLAHLIGIPILTSPNWALDHNDHHLTIGNVDAKPTLQHLWYDVDIMSKNQYAQLTTDKQLLHNLYKHPVIFFTIAPLFHFVIPQRYIYICKKIQNPDKYKQSLIIITLNHIFNNIGIILLMTFMYRHKIWLHYIISLFMYYSIKFMTLHNQHVFNSPYMVTNDKWRQQDSGLKGSSFIQIPKYLKYFFMGFEYHHIHHINTRIPGYNLQKYHEEVISKSNIFNDIIKINMIDFYNNLWFILYDTDTHRYITQI
jgi:omega-6 fatty acid desaturase (delta-12 desaturase)